METFFYFFIFIIEYRFNKLDFLLHSILLKASKEVYYIFLCEIGCNELKKIKGFNFYLIGIKILKCQVKVLFEWLATLVSTTAK